MSFWRYYGLVLSAAVRETFSHARQKIALGVILSVIAFVFQHLLQLRNWTDTAKIIITVLGASVVVIFGSFIKHLFLGPVLLHRRQQAEIDLLTISPSVPKPGLTGAVLSVGIDAVTESRCRVQITSWVRNQSNVGTLARVLSISLRDRKGEPLFLAWPPVGGQRSDLETKFQPRLEYGHRVEGVLPLIVETAMENVDTSSATITIADDFDQTLVLKF